MVETWVCWLAAGLLVCLLTGGWLLHRARTRRAAPPGRGVAAIDADLTASVWVVMNPAKHENPQAFRYLVDGLAAERGFIHLEWLTTTPQDPGTGQTMHALGQGASLVIAAGGDGTVRAVAAAMAHSGVRMGILPIGTGNLLARNLGLPLADHAAALDVALGTGHRRVDLAWLRIHDVEHAGGLAAEGALLASAPEQAASLHRAGVRAPSPDEFAFTVIAGVGFDGETMSRTDPQLKRRMGWPAYLVSALQAVGTQKFSARIRLEGSAAPRPGLESADPAPGSPTSSIEAQTVLFANCGRLPSIVLVPEAAVDDGMLDVVALGTGAGILGWVELTGRVLARSVSGHPFGSGSATARIHARQARGAMVSIDSPRIVQADGDVIGTARGVRARIDPGALEISADPGGLLPQRHRPPL